MDVIVIPTYWGWEKEIALKPGDSVFDHPTPIDGEDTLTRCLESIVSLNSNDFTVVIITATVNPVLNDATEVLLERIISPFKEKFPVMQFCHSDLKQVKDCLVSYGIREDFFSLKNYSTIRNCQLMVPAVLGAGLIAAIDDDEVVPPDFLKKARHFLGKIHNGKCVDGVAGFYFYEWGDYHVREPDGTKQADNLFKRKSVLQNQSFDLFMSREGRLVETSITLGGNMVFSRKLYMNVPFDPLVPRGEDIDYMINSRMLGYRWMMDKELRIDHYPPPCIAARKLQEDFTRFIYEKRKIELSRKIEGINPVLAEDLVPYPGEFLKERVVKDGLEALKWSTQSIDEETGNINAREILADARKKAEDAGKYFSYAKEWPLVMEQLIKDIKLKKYFETKLC